MRTNGVELTSPRLTSLDREGFAGSMEQQPEAPYRHAWQQQGEAGSRAYPGGDRSRLMAGYQNSTAVYDPGED